jgi:ribonuclease HI
VVLYFDGLCEPKNPGGIATYGIVIKKGEKTIFEDSGLADAEPWSEDASNNVAEYSGLIHGLEWLKSNGYAESYVIIRGDSKLVISQLEGTFKVKALRLVELFQKAKKLLSEFKHVEIEWVDRSKNSDADLLSRVAYSKYIKAHPQHRP